MADPLNPILLCSSNFCEITHNYFPFQKQSYTSGISGDTIAVHLSELGNKQIYTKTGYHKVRTFVISSYDNT